MRQERLPVNCIKLTSTGRGRALMLMIVKVFGSVVTPACSGFPLCSHQGMQPGKSSTVGTKFLSIRDFTRLAKEPCGPGRAEEGNAYMAL